MRTVKSEKEKERIRKRVEEIGGVGLDWEERYRKLSGELSDGLGRFVPVGDTGYISSRPASEEIEDIYHQWFPEDRDAAFTEETFKELPKRIMALTLETVIASEITEMLLSLTSIKRRVYDTPFLCHFKKRATDIVKRFSLNTTNITKLALKEMERNFSLPCSDGYHTLLNYLFGPKQNVPSIKRFVQAKHPDWFSTYPEDTYTTSGSSVSSEDSWCMEDWWPTDEGTPLTRETRKTMDDMKKRLKSGMTSRPAPETEEESKEVFKERGTSRCEDKD